jgi:hypothetical protein
MNTRTPIYKNVKKQALYSSTRKLSTASFRACGSVMPVCKTLLEN